MVRANKGKKGEAQKSLEKLMNPNDDIHARLAHIEATVELERRSQAETGTLLECFREASFDTCDTLRCQVQQAANVVDP